MGNEKEYGSETTPPAHGFPGRPLTFARLAKVDQACELYKRGLSFRVIGEILGCSKVEAWRLVRDGIAELNRRFPEDVKAVRRIVMERLNDHYVVARSLMDSPDPEIRARGLTLANQIEAQRCQFLGLNAPARVSIERDMLSEMPLEEIQRRRRIAEAMTTTTDVSAIETKDGSGNGAS